MKDPKKNEAAKAKAEEEAAAKAKAEAGAAAEAKAQSESQTQDRAVKTGTVLNRVRGPAPMMTEEGVKTAGEYFRCSAGRAKAYGKLIEADVEEPEAPESE